MNAIEKRIYDLHQLEPHLTAQSDLNEFWERSLKKAAEHPIEISMESITTTMEGVEAYRAAYRGFDETPIHGWYMIPRFVKREKYPAVVMYHGYQGSKLLPHIYAAWLMLGVAVFAVDTRGQSGETGNALVQNGGTTRGWMTANITDKENCYYKAIIIDAIRAVDWVAARPEIDSTNIGVAGGSQGGGLSLMTAILNKKTAYCIADIPNLCHMDFGILNSTGSLTEVADYVKRFPDQLDTVLETVSYFDIMNLADQLEAPVMMSVGLKDLVCMPETIFAAYNRIQAEKEIHVYPFSGHEISVEHTQKVLQYIKRRIAQ